MKLLQMADRVRYSRMTTSEKRETFLPEGMFNAMPTGLPLKLETQPELRADYFCERYWNTMPPHSHMRSPAVTCEAMKSAKKHGVVVSFDCNYLHAQVIGRIRPRLHHKQRPTNKSSTALAAAIPSRRGSSAACCRAKVCRGT